MGWPSGSGSLVTGDLYYFAKGAAVFTALAIVAAGAYAACHGWQWWRHRQHRPPRHPAVAAILAAGLLALEMLRIATACGPGCQPLLVPGVGPFPRRAGVALALCLWIWLEVAGIMGIYDTRLLPYLLHRVGQGWAVRGG